MLGHLAQLAQLMKSEGFAGENEFRIVVSDWLERHHNYRDTTHGIVGYARLTQNPANPKSLRIAYHDEAKDHITLPIRSVWLGPLLHTANNRATVQAFLKTRGFDGCAVQTSTVPLGH